MPVSTVHLTPKEQIVFNIAQRVPNVTAQDICDVTDFSYNSANRFLGTLTEKGYMLRSSERGPRGYQYMVPKVQRGNESLVIPYGQGNHPLADLLLYITQETEKENDFNKYGQVFSAGIYHLLYRRIQLRNGETPDGPTPTEIQRFIQASLRTYKDFIHLLETISDLPIYGEDDTIFEYFPEVNEKYLLEREIQLFQPFWRQGIASVFGLKGKFRGTLEVMKRDFNERYGRNKKL